MSRRHDKDSTGDLIFNLFTKISWWLWIVFAVLSYFVLHWVANWPISASFQPGQAGKSGLPQLMKSLANPLQYFMPMMALYGAAVSGFRLINSRKSLDVLVQNAFQPKKASRAVEGLSWQEFQQLMEEYFRHRGFAVIQRVGVEPGSDINLILRRAADKDPYLVQMKHWQAYKVGTDVIREMLDLVTTQGAAGGFVITAGEFTEPATQLSRGQKIELIDGKKLTKAMELAKSPITDSAAN